ncbi:MAG: zinc ABC transporter substrate-binding protein ZnuA [Pseudomonadales bacterium]
MIFSSTFKNAAAALAACTLFVCQLSTAAQPSALVSIKPLQLIASDIGRGVLEVTTLIPPSASPHDYALRPSDVKLIKRAGVTYWIGPELETFLDKVFKGHAENSVNFSDYIQPAQRGEEAHDEHASHTKHAGHDHSNGDPHIWLAPEGALAIAERMAQTLSARYPQHSATFAANLVQFKQQLTALDARITQQFAPLKQASFIVFHDGYSAFVEHYGLHQLAALTLNPAQQPGAKHLAKLRRLVASEKPSCLFSEPQFNPSAVESIAAASQTKVVTIDPLGSEINSEQNGYTTLLRGFADQFIRCLSN